MKIKSFYLVLCLLALSGQSLVAQGQQAPAMAENFSYSLPMTTVLVEVDAVKETYFAGPYARFARKFLGIDVPQKNSVKSSLSMVRIKPFMEADLATRFSLVPDSEIMPFMAFSSQGLVAFGGEAEVHAAEWHFTVAPPQADFNMRGISSGMTTAERIVYQEVQTDTAFIRVPVTEKYQVVKTLEQRAEEAARLILKAREEKFNITIGNTDATYSGEALGSAIAELTRMEEEYMTMFAGYYVKEEQHKTFYVTPAGDRKDQTYQVFRFSSELGVLDTDSQKGKPYFISFEAEPVKADPEETVPAKVPAKTQYVHYRIPATCSVTLYEGADKLIKTRFPIYQLGRESTFPVFPK